jgi:lipoic acid synthetase
VSESEDILRIPPWLRVKLPQSRCKGGTRDLLDDLNLNTVCQGAKCPNLFECFGKGVATFLILGRNCTRDCRFCNISPGAPQPVEPDEPERVAEAARRLELTHVVVTSVTRDDLADGGAGHFAATLRAIRQALPRATTEVLIPDFKGEEGDLRTVLDAGPDVLNHNLETARALSPEIRPQADYARSLELLRRSKAIAPDIPVKSGLMVGLGETDEQVRETMRDLAGAGCDIVTVGQYMRPSLQHPPVKRYVHPDVFEEYARYGESLGIPHTFAAPLVRSSYNAEMFARAGKEA